jgi:hypothetical protein
MRQGWKDRISRSVPIEAKEEKVSEVPVDKWREDIKLEIPSYFLTGFLAAIKAYSSASGRNQIMLGEVINLAAVVTIELNRHNEQVLFICRHDYGIRPEKLSEVRDFYRTQLAICAHHCVRFVLLDRVGDEALLPDLWPHLTAAIRQVRRDQDADSGASRPPVPE